MAYTTTFPETFSFPRIERRTIPKKITYDYSITTNFTGTRAGSNVRDWKERIRLGQAAASPYTIDRARIVHSEPGYAHVQYRSTQSPFSQTGMSTEGFVFTPDYPPTPLGVSSAKAESIALSKIYKKIETELSHMNAPAFFAEGIDVIRQFGKPADAIIDLTNRHLNRLVLERRGLKGSTTFKKVRWAQVVASTYLEYAFGLKPLISDSKKAAEALARFHNEADLPKYRTRVVSRESTSLAANITSFKQAIGGSYITSTVYKNTVTDSRCQYVVGMSAPPIAAYGSNDRLLQLFGFQPENWIPAIYEAIPWSWLLDYFTNVQEILNAGVTSTASVKWIVKTVSQRTLIKQSSSTTAAGVTWDSALIKDREFSSKTGHMGYFEAVRTNVRRTLPTTLGIPGLYIEHPFENASKVANLVALLFARKPGNSALWIF